MEDYITETIRKCMNKKADFNILMVGGRRTGKTSVLASFLSSYQNICAGSDLVISTDAITMPAISDKMVSLHEVFNLYGAYDEFDPDTDAAPGYERIDHYFNLGIAGKKGSKYSMRFTDVPGEWFIEDAASHEEEVSQLFDESNILIIAIDTPHLMECDESGKGFGRFHEAFNGANIFTNNIMDRLIIKDGVALKKMILFMPLKCEKYFFEKRPDGNARIIEIPEAIEKGYKNLLKHLSSDNLKGECEVAVIPVQTMGNLIFSRFAEDENGKIMMHETRFVPMKSLYRFPNERAYSEGLQPEYCEQPLIYILMYVLKMARIIERAKTNWLSEIFTKIISFIGICKIANDADMMKALNDISNKMEKNLAKGFKIIQNPLNF
jgi:hypothetical protein